MIKQDIVKGKTNIGFGNSMLESRRVTFDIEPALMLHTLIIPYLNVKE